MFGFIKKAFFAGLTILSTLTSVNSLSSISVTNQKCEIRPKIVNVNSDEPVFYPFSMKTSKYSGSCDNINNPYTKLCVPDVVKSWNVKLLNLMSTTNEARHVEWHETFKCNCRLDSSVCNNKQRWSDDKCRCEFKELIDKVVCDKGSIWNPSNCECECDKSCDVGEFLDYENCKCRKKLVDKLIEHSSTEEWTENIDEEKIAEMALFEHGNDCPLSYTIVVILAVIAFIISIGIGAYFVYSGWYLKKDLIRVRFGTRTQWNCSQTTIYWTYRWKKSNK